MKTIKNYLLSYSTVFIYSGNRESFQIDAGFHKTKEDASKHIEELKTQLPHLYTGHKWYIRDIYDDGSYGKAEVFKDETNYTK
jgi:hypothetical protein